MLHVTDRQTFKTCRRKFKYAVLDRLAPKNGRGNDFLELGSYGHLLLENYYRAKVGMDLADVSALAAFLETNDPEGKETIDALFAAYVEKYADEPFEVMAVEKSLEVPLNEFGFDGVLSFRCDLIVLAEGGYYIVDHKFLKNRPSSLHLEVDDQMTAYIWACRRVGIPVEGAIYDAIIKRRMRKPPLLASGGLSVSKTTLSSTTPGLLREAALENGLDPADYEEAASSVWSCGLNDLFERRVVRRTPAELEAWEKNLAMELNDLADAMERGRMYPNPGFSCSWCEFQQLCKAENLGSGVFADVKDCFYRQKSEDER